MKLTDSEGQEWQWDSESGRRVVLYFYPKDDTPGCTIQAQEFSQLKAAFAKLNTVVIGVSRDSVKSHGKFRDKYKLKINLLSDEAEKACQLFDVIKEKNMYGKKVIGIERSTFLLDEGGTLLKEWRKVKAAGHAEMVRQYILSL